METTPQRQPEETPPDIDPTADLELLKRASSVGINHSLDFGPWWMAVALATCIACLTLFGQEMRSTVGIAAAVVGFGVGIATIAYDLRRRRVRPKASAGGAASMAVIVLVTYVVAGLWGSAISRLGVDRFLPGYFLLGWALTAAFFLGVRAVSYAILARRQILT